MRQPGVISEQYNLVEAVLCSAFLDAGKGFSVRSIAEAELPVSPSLDVDTIRKQLPGLKMFLVRDFGKGRTLFLRKAGELLAVNVNAGKLDFEVWSATSRARERADEILKALEPLRSENRSDQGVWCDFCHWASCRLQSSRTFLRTPTWEAIRGNYPSQVRAGVERLAVLERPWEGGRLVLWHGPPGTGKTYAVRALMQAWKKTFDFSVINDPELFARDPGYYSAVASPPRDEPPEESEYLGEPLKRPRRKLFILEDSADLILQESRTLHYDKIGKLLNMTDGLFGQGREDLFLITFNEAVDRIDPAFTRPGRCAGLIEFARFPAAEAAQWLRSHEAASTDVPAGPLSLAELYERLRNPQASTSAPASKSEPVGFAIRARA